VCCSVLQRVAACCGVSQRVAACRSVSQRVAVYSKDADVGCQKHLCIHNRVQVARNICVYSNRV